MATGFFTGALLVVVLVVVLVLALTLVTVVWTVPSGLVTTTVVVVTSPFFVTRVDGFVRLVVPAGTGFVEVASYDVPTTRALEGVETKRVRVLSPG